LEEHIAFKEVILLFLFVGFDAADEMNIALGKLVHKFFHLLAEFG
jgi:hypothetical protein